MKAYIFERCENNLFTIACPFDKEMIGVKSLILTGTKGQVILNEDNIQTEKQYSWGYPKMMRIYTRGIDLDNTIGELLDIKINKRKGGKTHE